MNTLLKTKQDKIEFLTWVGSLLSGALPQGHGDLENKDGFCCLGVGEALFAPDDKVELSLFTINNEDRYFIAGCVPSNGAPEWLQKINVDYAGKTGHSLITRNDDHLWSFKQIGQSLLAAYKQELNNIPD